MRKVKEIKRLSENSIAYQGYKDDHSLAEDHDIIVKALAGQSYLKETLHKVSTTQVTGDALMKVSVGGKGGFGSQGDVREQKSELNADVVRMEKKEVFQQRLELQRAISEGKLDIDSKDEWTAKHRAKMKAKHGGGRDYDDFSYQSECDARDCLNAMEKLYANQYAVEEMGEMLGLKDNRKPFTISQIHGNKSHKVTFGEGKKITKKQIERARNRFDELAGYRGAWKHTDRHYRITIVNTLNLDTADAEKTEREKEMEAFQLANARQSWDQKMSHQCYVSRTQNSRRDDAFAMWEILNQYTPTHYSERWLNGLGASNIPKKEENREVKKMTEDELKAYNSVRLRAERYELPSWMGEGQVRKYGRSSEFYENEIQPWLDRNGFDLRDWKIVYKWECTAEGKGMFTNHKFNQ